MFYMYRIRQLVRIVADETEHSTDDFNESHESPNLNHVLRLFQHKYGYDEAIAHKTLAIATGPRGYLKIDRNDRGQALQVLSDGLELLTFTGFVNAAAETVKHPAPLVISTIALLLSTWLTITR